LCIASGLHLVLTFQRQVVAQPHDVPRAAKIAGELNRGPVFLANLTTVVGFLSMNTADSPPIRELGNLVAIGLTAGTSALLIIVPQRLTRVRTLRMLATVEWLRPLLERLARGNPRRRALLALGITALCVAGIPRIHINDDFVRYFDTTFEFRRAADFSQQHMSGPNYLDLSVSSGMPDGIYDPRYLATLREFASWLRSQPLVANVASLSDVVAEVADKFGTNDFATLTREEIAQFVLTYELSLTAGQDLDDFFDKSRSATRVSVLLSGGDSQSVIALEHAAYAWFRERAPSDYAVVVTGINVPVAHMSVLNIRSMLVGILSSLLIIAIAVAIYFRDVRVVLFVGPTILVPMVMGFGMWGWFVGDIGFAAAVVAAMTIGILDYDAIHVTYRYRHARRVLGVPPGEAVDLTLMTVGHAVLVNSLALAAGFVLLVFSGFEVNRALGLCTTLIMLSGLIVHLLLVPSALEWLDRRAESRLSLTAVEQGK
jgi:predicted RND superfamily exporter protein